MKILQCGFPKSGNYWLYRIIKLIREKAGIPEKSFIHEHPIFKLAREWDLSYPEQAEINMLDILESGCFFRISSRYREQVDNFREYVENNSHVWTHSNFCNKSRETFPLFDKVVYIVRDPRDVAISTSRFAFSNYMQKHYPTWHATPKVYMEEEFQNVILNWADHVEKYLREKNNQNIHITFYEQWRARFDDELNSLLDYLEIELSQKQKLDIKRAVSFRALKRKSPNHLRKGQFYGWMTELEFKQKEDALDIAAPLLKSLNYPLKDFYQSPPLPFFMENNIPEMEFTYPRPLASQSGIIQ